MKKVLCLLMVCMMAGIFSACGETSTNEKAVQSDAATASSSPTVGENADVINESEVNTDSKDETADMEGTIAVDENLFTVDVTMPAACFEDATDESLQKNVEENGYKSGKLNEDGSVTYTVSKAQYSDLLDNMKAMIDETIDEMVSGESKVESFTEITYNEDINEFYVYVDKALYTSWDSLNALSLYVVGAYYQILAGNDDKTIIVDFIDKDTGEVIESGDSSKMVQ